MKGSEKKLRKLMLFQKYITFCIERELGIQDIMLNDERMLKWFEYAHLPEHLQEVSKPFGELAKSLCDSIQAGPERTVALRKLLEAKDAAVRAKLNPGG